MEISQKRVARRPSLALLKELRLEGYSLRGISSRLSKQGYNLTFTAVKRRLDAMGVKAGGLRNVPRRAIDAGTLRHIARLVAIYDIRTVPAIVRALNEEGKKVSCVTVWRAMKRSEYLVLKHPRKRPALGPSDRRARLRWSRSANFTWKKFYYGDEKSFFIDGPAWRRAIWVDKRFDEVDCPRLGLVRPGAVFFGCFSQKRVPDLVRLPLKYNSGDYSEAVRQCLFKKSFLFHDMHPVHRSRHTMDSLKKKRIRTQLFPPRGADLNPMENLWGILQAKVFPKNKTYKSVDCMIQAITDAWKDIQQNRMLRVNLVRGMPQRDNDVKMKRGGFCKK